MDKSDSSLLRSLAVAFGDGLAFGVGMKLTQNSSAKPGSIPAPDVAGRLFRIEQRVDRVERAPASLAGSASLEPRTVDSLTRALEARIQEHAALTERRLAELDVNVSLELKSVRDQQRSLTSTAETGLAEIQKRLDEKIQALVRQVNEDRSTLQNQVISLHREFASAVAAIVEAQVATQIEERLGKLVEERLKDVVREQLGPVEQELREEIRQASAAKHREIADLRQRLVESDRNVLDVMLSTGELFRQAATRFSAPALSPAFTAAPLAPSEPARTEPPPVAEKPGKTITQPIAAAGSEPPAIAENIESTKRPVLYDDSELPSFARPRKAAAAAALSIPLVASFLVTAGCVALLQYL